ncbi:hypothetical protein FB384_004926 [Prauserella sediminis]|uniref:Uncharacterized protein n=1 Tax=Prauserella sediminis TaxID=577680 RepID=A0A839XTB2_9PSEU|nr:hypothetical protein [Prauserella sediminis]
MSLNFEEAYERARPVSPFANGDEWEEWSESWCGTCLRDAPHRRMGSGSDCPLVMVAFSERTPAEWLDGPRDEQGRYRMSEQYVCVEYRRPGGGGGEPRPQPEPLDMEGLFPRPERAVRMPVLPETAAVVGRSA